MAAEARWAVWSGPMATRQGVELTSINHNPSPGN